MTLDWLKRIEGRPLADVRAHELPCTCILQYRPYRDDYEWVEDSCCPRHRVYPRAPRGPMERAPA